MWVVALPVAIPLVLAAILAGAGKWIPRKVLDLTSVLGTLSVLIICGWLVHLSQGTTLTYWFGGWEPHGQVAVGISFQVDPLGAGLATFTSLLVLCSFLFSWHYFKAVKSYYHTLMLVFLAAMCGFCLTGDLFNLFVWFELMSAAGIALCGYKAEELGPLQGAMNFAVTNTVGAFVALTGIALLYGRTGALNMVQAGQTLAAHPQDTLVLIAFIFFACGFLVKAAVVPFHFWLADAHAVAPTPVCVLFSGIMVELGLYAVVRTYSSVFSVALAPHAEILSRVFLTMGVITAILGGVLCFLQRHLKRLLAFSTISHVGLMVIAFSLLDPRATAGLEYYVFGHGLVKGSLFLCSGILLHRFESVDEFDLQGKAREGRVLMFLFFLAALGLTGAPPFLGSRGEAIVTEVAQGKFPWVEWIYFLAGILTSAAVLRAGGRIFLGWGHRHPDGSGASPGHEKSETQGDHSESSSLWMFVPTTLLLGLSIAGSWVPSGWLGISSPPPITHGLVQHLACVAGAVLLALFALFRGAWFHESRAQAARGAAWVVRTLHDLHSGQVGDYLVWLSLGIVVYGSFLLFAT